MRSALKWGGVAVGTLILCSALLFGTLQTGFGRKGLAALAGKMLAGAGWTVEAGAVKGVFPFHFQMERMSVANKEGRLILMEDLEIHWSLLSLLRGEIHVHNLRCALFVIDRLPQRREEQDGSSRANRLVALIERIRVDRLSVNDLILGERVLGEKAAFRLDADLKAAPPGGEWAARVTLDRKDGVEARILVEGTIWENGRVLLLNVEGREARGGVFSRRAGIEGPVSFTLHGEGPCTKWQGRMELRAGGGGVVEADILASDENGIKLGMEGYAQSEAGFFPGLVEELTRGRIRFSLKCGVARGEILIEHLSADSGGGGLELTGSLNPASGALKAHLKGRHGDLKQLEKRFPVALGGRVSLDGSISGTLFRPSATVRVDIGALTAEGVSIPHLDGEIQVEVADMQGSGPVLRLKADGKGSGLSVRGMAPLPERDLRWNLSGERTGEGRILVKGFNLKGEKNSLLLSGEIDPSTWDGNLETDAEFKDLTGYSRIAGMDLPGAGRLKTKVAGNFKSLSFSGVLKGSLEPLDSIVPVLREKIKVEAKISLEQGRLLTIADVDLANSMVALTGGGRVDLPKRQGTGTAHIQIRDLKTWSSLAEVALGGSVHGSAGLDFSPEKSVLQTEIHGKEVLIGTIPLDRVRIALSGSGKRSANDGSFQFEAGEEAARVSGEGKFSLKGEALSLTKMSVSGPGKAGAKGSFHVDLQSMLAEGRFSGHCPDLAVFSGLANRPLKGSADFSADMGKSGDAQRLKLVFTGNHLGSANSGAAEVKLVADLTGLSGRPRGSANAEFRDLRIPGVHFGSLTLKAEGDGGEISFAAKTKGMLDRKFELEAKGRYRDAQPGFRVMVTQLQGRYGELPIRTPEPFALEQSEAEVSTEVIRFLLGGGTLSLAGKFHEHALDLSFKFDDLPLSLLSPPALHLLEGSGSGELDVRGSLESPEAMVRVRIIGLRSRDPQLKSIPPAVLEAEAALRDRRLSGKMALHGVTSQPFMAAVDLPLGLSLAPFRVSLTGDERIEGELKGNADLARLGGFLGMDGQGMSGAAHVELYLEGTPDRPLMKGTISVENGGYENARSGTLLKDVNVLLVAGEKVLSIGRASAGDGEEGTATAEGWLEVDPKGGFPFQVGVDFQKLRIARHDRLTAKGNGKVWLRGSFSGAVLSGEVQVESGEFRIPERLPPDLIELEVIEINGPDSTVVGPKKGKKDPYLDFDLQLNTPGRFFVRGRGLESEWRGGLRLTGPSVKPALDGELSVERGRFAFLDKRFNLTEGKITFHGDANHSPYLDAVAQSSAKGITAYLRLTGPLRSPEIRLSSEPSLPSEEVLSRLLFGQSMNRISPLQAIQLAQTLNLMRGGNTIDLIGATRKLLRIDQLEVKNSGNDDNETSISAGKYLNEKVYIEVEKSLGPGGAKGSVEWELTPNITLETEIGIDAESGVGINWKWDY